MDKSAGFNLQDASTGGGNREDSKVEQLASKLRRHQQEIRSLEEEIKEAKALHNSLQKEFASKQCEAYELERILQEKEEMNRILQFQCDESEQECFRQLQLNKKTEERLEKYKCEIQEFKLKHRKQRMKFENSLHQLIEQHKNLHSVFTPERLPHEIERVENATRQLLAVEQVKLAQLHHLGEELEQMKLKQQRAAAAQTQG